MKFRKKVFCSITTLAILVASIVFSAAMVSHPQQASAKEPAKRVAPKTIEYAVLLAAPIPGVMLLIRAEMSGWHYPAATYRPIALKVPFPAE